jgi:lipopolysaccharide transport system ATP-binding protein
MDDIAIRVEGLGKRFRLRHATGGPRYRTFREDLLGLPRRLLNGLRGKSGEQEEFWALKDVSFEVKQGEVLGIIGRNGAGKSTLLKVLSRIMDPTCGEATVHGRIGSLLEVGTGFHPELTGRENIFLSGALLGMKRDEVRRRFDEIVAFASVEKFLDTPCKHYSSGMYTRLGFAVAAHLDTEILLVDEVLAVGDAEFQRKCLGKMSEVAVGGRTVLFVSHQLAMMQSLCSCALYFDQGHICYQGAATQVVERYLEDVRQIPAGDINRGSRTGNGGGRILGFSVRACDGASTLSTGCAARFELTISSAIERSEVVIGIGIDGEQSGRLATLFSHFTNTVFHVPANRPCVVDCTVAALPLTPGRYWVAIHMAQDSDVLEHLEQATTFEVTDGNFFGTGRLPSGPQGALVLSQHWSMTT